MIYLDMDGVLADFHSRIISIHGVNPYLDENNRGDWDAILNGKTIEDFYAPCEFDFWADLPPTKEFSKILSWVFGYAKVNEIAILTSPSPNHGCVPGKKEWVRRHCPVLKQQIIYAQNKHLIASPGKILIDDSDRHVTMWQKHGGKAILIPRPWNSKHHRASFAVDDFMEQVKALE